MGGWVGDGRRAMERAKKKLDKNVVSTTGYENGPYWRKLRHSTYLKHAFTWTSSCFASFSFSTVTNAVSTAKSWAWPGT